MTHALSDAAFYRLMTFMSPSYPTGAYTYSHGLEAAVEAGAVADAESAFAWIADVLARGGGFADLVFLLEAHRAASDGDLARLAAAAELARAFAPTAELLLETTAQGDAFVQVTLAVGADASLLRSVSETIDRVPLPVAAGCAAAEAGAPARAAALAYAHAFAANLVSACLRLAPVGQTDGQRLLARLEPLAADAVERAGATAPGDLALSTLAVDIGSMRHETQHTRLFRS
jgi:urease accessory protein